MSLYVADVKRIKKIIYWYTYMYNK
jgi:hypothetical protein